VAGACTSGGVFANGAAYAVSVKTQYSVPTQNCVVSHGNGMIAGDNVTNVAVPCPTVVIASVVRGDYDCDFNAYANIAVSWTWPAALPRSAFQGLGGDRYACNLFKGRKYSSSIHALPYNSRNNSVLNHRRERFARSLHSTERCRSDFALRPRIVLNPTLAIQRDHRSLTHRPCGAE
jgi:hypothetical protein